MCDFSRTLFSHLGMAKSSKFLYNLESLPLFDRPHEYGYIYVFIYTVIREELEPHKMEFTVSKADLVRELSLSQGVVEKKTTIPILSNVLLEARGDRLYLTATDLELGLRTSCPAKVKKEGSGTIPARKLLDYVRLLPDADITVKFAENHWANFTCGRSRTRIAGMSRESFPELPAMPETIAEIPVKQLSAMIARTMFAISMEESRFTLNGALLLLGDKTLTMVATDGHRLAYVQRPSRRGERTGLAYRALVPRKAMAEITKLSDDARRRRESAVRRRRQSSVFRVWSAAC